MEQLQLDIFTIEQPQFIEPAGDHIVKGDRVRIIADQLDAEALNYYEYYYPIALRSPGMVVEVCNETKNDYLKLIYKNGEEILIEKMNVKKED